MKERDGEEGGPRRFWEYLDALVAAARVVVDRPRGSRHPRYHEIVYPLDYGYLEGTSAPDGTPVDVWVGSASGAGVTGTVATVGLVKRDAEVKVLLDCTPGEMRCIRAFHNEDGQAAALLVRDR